MAPVRIVFPCFAHIRQELAYLKVKTSYLRLQATLKAGFDPNQPRVPVGNPDGGQWTSTSGSTGAGPGGAADTSTIRRDATGKQPWHSIVTRQREDGSIALETIINRDGSAIRSEFPDSPDEAGFDERHTVIGADGTLVTFQNSGSTQTIYSEEGQVLSVNEWTASGPEPLARVQPAFLPGAVVVEEATAATVRLGLMLYGWYLSRKQPGQTPVVALNAREFQAPDDPAGIPELTYVGNLTSDQVDNACDRMGDVQNETDKAVDIVGPKRDILSPSQYGTAVHMQLKAQIDDLDDPNFRAEVSVLKSLEEAYGTKNSVRIDVFENVGNGTVCVYDIKTGKSGLSLRRSVEIATKVHSSFSEARRIIIIETRPTR